MALEEGVRTHPSPTTWHPRIVTLLALLGLCCVPVTRGPGALSGGRAQFRQSCGAACAAPIQVSTGEFLAPSASRGGSVLVEKTLQATKAAQGFVTVERLLTEAELERVEAILWQCVVQAHADVNAAYQQGEGGFKFKNKKFPNDTECGQEVGVDDDGNAVTLAQELGRLKHAAAFSCLGARLAEFRGNFSIEPRYKGSPQRNGTVLTNNKLESLHPDVVVHAMRNATNVQCVYELKFPCYERHRLNPMDAPTVGAQLDSYQYLAKGCRVTLVTPSGGLEPYKGR
jgi:hypothetical protein